MEEFTKSFIDSYNAIGGVIVAILTAIFGAYWYIFAAYLVFNVIDWLTGWRKARVKKTESSKVGLKGALKKVGYWIVIAVAFLTSYVFVKIGDDLFYIDLSFLSMIGWFTLAMLLVNEVRSILENLLELGYNIPTVLIKGLSATEEIIEKLGSEESEE